jgi:hypothetical protein
MLQNKKRRTRQALQNRENEIVLWIGLAASIGGRRLRSARNDNSITHGVQRVRLTSIAISRLRKRCLQSCAMNHWYSTSLIVLYWLIPCACACCQMDARLLSIIQYLFTFTWI